jgi:hypothetical protein
MASFWVELKRRRVVRASVVYAVVAWVLIQIVDVVAPTLLLPAWVGSLVTFLLILGFPVAVVLAWAYDLTPAGIICPGQHDGDESRPGNRLLPCCRLPTLARTRTMNISVTESPKNC